MKFLVKRRRTAPAVIIVALIDVLIVLVIFLLVTTTFKQTPSLRLTLPASRQPLKSGVSDNPPQVVTIPTNAGVLYLGINACTLDQLQRQLTALAAENPKLKVIVRADQNAPWSRIVEVMDAAKAAKVTDLSAFTKAVGKP